MRHVAWFLYQAAMASGLALAAPVLLIRRGRHYLATLPGRLGLRVEPALPGALWIHAVSVGEVGVAATLARALPESLPLVITTVTPTGQERARTLFGGGVFAERDVRVAYLPFDLGFAVGAFLERFQPIALVLVEGDYWPLVLHHAERRQMPVAVVNGRIGERTFEHLSKVPGVGRRLFFDAVRVFGVQSGEDRRRLVASGAAAERVRVTGNLKYETPAPDAAPALLEQVRRLAGERPILIAGSTMAGEDRPVLEAFERLGGGRRALLVLVPRHPERWHEAASLVRERGFELVRRSVLDQPDTLPPHPDVLLLDSLGELAALYEVADAAFIGGTLVPTGGHNPLEPARFAIPIVVGPSMENFAEMAADFDRVQAWQRVDDPSGLAAAWERWLDDPDAARAVGERARQLLLANRGALAHTLEMLAPLLPAEPLP